ncbi:MAG: hypothetical protein Q9182_004953 [Xanthomendoza sp. 2 TL-2023]
MQGEVSWTYDSVLLGHAPKRITLQVLIVNHVMENIICHVGDNHPTTAEARLFDALAAAPSALACVSQAINTILTLCRNPRPRRSLGQSNPACRLTFLDPSLPTPPFEATSSHRRPAVVYQGLQYVGKHPRDCNRLDADFAEVENALNLPRPHPNLLPPPQYLVTVSSSDHRVCGFLILYYPKGELYQWSRKLASQGRWSESHLREWALATASAMEFLVKCGEWHGDLKPDNIFVGEAGNLVLADRTRDFATIAFASPELLDDHIVTWNEEGQLQYEPREAKRARQYLGLPVQWPLDAKEKSEVYAFGILLLVLIRNMSPSDVYCKAQEAGSQCPD